jgi:hypothetical protein
MTKQVRVTFETEAGDYVTLTLQDGKIAIVVQNPKADLRHREGILIDLPASDLSRAVLALSDTEVLV